MYRCKDYITENTPKQDKTPICIIRICVVHPAGPSFRKTVHHALRLPQSGQIIGPERLDGSAVLLHMVKNIADAHTVRLPQPALDFRALSGSAADPDAAEPTAQGIGHYFHNGIQMFSWKFCH